MRGIGIGQDLSAASADLLSHALMDRRGGDEPDAAVPVLVAAPAEERDRLSHDPTRCGRAAPATPRATEVPLGHDRLAMNAVEASFEGTTICDSILLAPGRLTGLLDGPAG